MRILLADDHVALRKGLRQILAEAFPDAEFGETADTPETLAALHEKPWDVIVLDITMPGRSGLEVLEEARTSFPKIPVLVFSSTPEEQLAMRALKAGAAGFLNKQSVTEELVLAVRKVAAGGRYISPTLTERLVGEFGRSAEPPHESLSNREFEIFQLMLTGLGIKEIAASLSLSPKTVSTFRCRVFEKLRVHNDVELVHYAQRHQLTSFVPPVTR